MYIYVYTYIGNIIQIIYIYIYAASKFFAVLRTFPSALLVFTYALLLLYDCCTTA